MCGTLEKYFFKFYPTMKKKAYTSEGEWMRCVSAISVVIHNCLFIFCLAFVGFYPMIFNFVQACWSYSVYLTLREREMAFYLLLLVGQVVCDLSLIRRAEEGKIVGLQLGGFIGNMVACGILLWANGRAWYSFRNSGGLRGKSGMTEPLLVKDGTGADEESKQTTTQ